MLSGSDVLKEGWMTKQGGLIKSWKKRWFVLHDTDLDYFIKPNGKQQGTIPIHDAKVIQPSPECKKQPSFKIVIPGVRVYYIQTNTTEEVQDWIAALEKARSGVKASVSTAVHLDDFDIIKVIGRGTYGKVQLVRNKNDGQLYAMKSMSKRLLEEYGQIEQTITERDVLFQTVHPFLVGAHFTFQNDTKIFLILDYVPGGELFGRLKEETRFPVERVKIYAAEILLGLMQLHKLGFIYRDLKPENILVDRQGHLKITDFGLVKTDMKGDQTTNTFCGTPEYIAPEMLQSQPYTRAVDWWSFGILIFEMLTGLPPFYDENTNKMYRDIIQNEPRYPHYIPEQAKALMERLLKKDPKERLGSGESDGEEIKRDPFFDGINWTDVLEKRTNPGYVPQIANDTDTNNFDDEFTHEKPVVSYEDASMIQDDKQQAFADFTLVNKSGFHK